MAVRCTGAARIRRTSVRRCARHGASGTLRVVSSTTAGLTGVRAEPRLSVELRDGRTHEHRRTPEGWHIDTNEGDRRKTIDLGGVVELEPAGAEQAMGARIESSDSRGESVLTLVRGKARRSSSLARRTTGAPSSRAEEADRPSGVVTMRWDESALLARIAAHRVAGLLPSPTRSIRTTTSTPT